VFWFGRRLVDVLQRRYLEVGEGHAGPVVGAVASRLSSGSSTAGIGLVVGPLPVDEPTDEIEERGAFVSILERWDALFVKNNKRLVHAALEFLGQHGGEQLSIVGREATEEIIDRSLIWDVQAWIVCVGSPDPCPDPACPYLSLSVSAGMNQLVD
jgi:hypothetical protein